ncbi:hypothetical protein [Candidatus Contubernalis alkaliaceticus]|uniref:hypothetical protein n=1 Tax=Candidatus Contubernalis alkaliaceticus TaxID=338645 RepID=UPI001F4C4CC8|nr:hypothetical protein [Candidatus Contubernalis alkalaceticus]UNC93269.1 hypothetical protein HUE98_14940 [Candidatus Contubernalis alkalaceticus]
MRNFNREIIKKEICSSFQQNKCITIVLILLCVVSFTLVAMVAANTMAAYSSTGHFKEFIGKRDYYTLHDNADDDNSYKEYMNSDEQYYRLQNFVNQLKQNEKIVFISSIRQPLDVSNINIPGDIPEKFFFWL